MSSTSDSDLMQEFALMSLSSFKYQATDVGTNLVLSLNHSESAIRKHAVNQLATMLKNEVCYPAHCTCTIFEHFLDANAMDDGTLTILFSLNIARRIYSNIA